MMATVTPAMTSPRRDSRSLYAGSHDRMGRRAVTADVRQPHERLQVSAALVWIASRSPGVSEVVRTEVHELAILLRNSLPGKEGGRGTEYPSRQG